MATKRILSDPDFGQLIIRSRRGARNYSFRVKEDGVQITVPPQSRTAHVLEVLEGFREKLKVQFEQVRKRPIDFSYRIDAPCFKLKLIPSSGRLFTVKEVDEAYLIACPSDVDWEKKEVQGLLRAAILRALKKRAATYLPPLLEMWSRRFHLPYKKCRITGAKSRWGSCTTGKTISLSCYLMLLPPHLMDYVILHELTHTREMNHGPAFWQLLDSMTEGMAQHLRRELRGYRTAF